MIIHVYKNKIRLIDYKAIPDVKINILVLKARSRGLWGFMQRSSSAQGQATTVVTLDGAIVDTTQTLAYLWSN